MSTLFFVGDERDPQSVQNQEHSGGPVAFNVTQGRVEYYSDVVDHLVNTEIARCKAKGFNPSEKQIAFFRKEVVRHAVIRHDVVTATQLKIQESSILLS